MTKDYTYLKNPKHAYEPQRCNSFNVRFHNLPEVFNSSLIMFRIDWYDENPILNLSFNEWENFNNYTHLRKCYKNKTSISMILNRLDSKGSIQEVYDFEDYTIDSLSEQYFSTECSGSQTFSVTLKKKTKE